MKQKLIVFLMAVSLFMSYGAGNTLANFEGLEKDETVSTKATGNNNFQPPSVLPPQC
ncbi:MAG TPA: hypothetical protein K8V56_20845 [Sporosarcina psychrophila]|uniref:Uncharacterized protein n=1 Tax=Sporosarcina psychrophila TaxID=1476 RepID=A0A921G2G8_SPOPS|nr:hypothetical protein [Sporosarcina psychrophila]